MNNLEILKLKSMLEEADIPFYYTDDMFENGEEAYQIIVNVTKYGDRVDAICNDGSYGSEDGLLEIMGGLSESEGEHECVLGWLTAKEVFKRFKYCYENHTTVYREYDIREE